MLVNKNLVVELLPCQVPDVTGPTQGHVYRPVSALGRDEIVNVICYLSMTARAIEQIRR